jgi:hypothetical protein
LGFRLRASGTKKLDRWFEPPWLKPEARLLSLKPEPEAFCVELKP